MSERSTWLRRLVVEFGVIVVGVLVALLAESWWQQRGERAAELETLARIAADLEADSASLYLYGRWLELVQPSFDAAREALQGSSELAPSAALALTYAAATQVMGGRPLSTWDELAASGGLAELSDAGTRQALVGFYSDFEDMVEAGRSLPEQYRIAVTAVVPVPVTTRILAECLRERVAEDSAEPGGPRDDVLEALRTCSAVDPDEARRYLTALRERSGFREALEARAYEVSFVAEQHRIVGIRFDSLRVHLDRALAR